MYFVTYQRRQGEGYKWEPANILTKRHPVEWLMAKQRNTTEQYVLMFYEYLQPEVAEKAEEIFWKG